MSSMTCKVDDKYIPLYRIVWISDLPHFCGHDDCEHEGSYEIRLEQGDSVWAASQEERDAGLCRPGLFRHQKALSSCFVARVWGWVRM